MSDGAGSRTSNYGTPSRILAAVLSPWVVILFAVGFLAILYRLYYRPRLHYSYRAYPNPDIYFVPPFFRRRQFSKNPVTFLSNAKDYDSSSSLFWTDAIKGYGTKTVSIVTDDALVLQFLSREDRDTLSWDAPLRSAWNLLFDRHSAFGSISFWTASRYCLVNGFSPFRTAVASPNSQIVEEVSQSTLAQFANGDLGNLVQSIVLQSLLQIFLGSCLTEHISRNGLQLLKALKSESTSRKNVQPAMADFTAAIQNIIHERFEDVEKHAQTDDYLQWLIKTRYSTEFESATSESKKPSTAIQAHEVAGVSVAETPIEESHEEETSRQRRETKLKRDLPDHIIATFLQTHLLVESCVIWAIYSELTMDNQISPDPLLLVRKTRKESLLGNTILPKDSYIAVSPILQRNGKPLSDVSVSSEGKRQTSITELSTLSAVNSVTDLTDLAQDSSIFGLHNSPSTGSFSPLLRSARNFTNTSLNDLSEAGTRANIEPLYKSRKGSWVRRYPQGHLISLVVGSVTNTLSRNLAVTGSASVRPKYGPAKLMWLPFPSSSIHVTKVPPSSRSVFNVRSRSGSVSQFTKSKLNEEVEVKL